MKLDKNTIRVAAKIAAKCPAIRKQVLDYIKHGRGYSDPTDLYDSFTLEKVPQKYHKYFEVDEDDIAVYDAEKGILYSVDGTKILFDAVLDYKRK